MCEFKVAQIPFNRAVKQHFQHTKLKLYTVHIQRSGIGRGGGGQRE